MRCLLCLGEVLSAVSITAEGSCVGLCGRLRKVVGLSLNLQPAYEQETCRVFFGQKRAFRPDVLCRTCWLQKPPQTSWPQHVFLVTLLPLATHLVTCALLRAAGGRHPLLQQASGQQVLCLLK